MKRSLRLSFFRSFTGERGLVSSSHIAISPSGFRLKGSENLRQSLHSSTDDDDFAELGLPVQRVVRKTLKLKTEKPEPFRKGKAINNLILSYMKPESSSSLDDVRRKLGESDSSSSLVGSATVKNSNNPVRSDAQTVTITIRNISSTTADHAIHSICVSYGCLRALTRTEEGSVDVIFGVSDKSDIQNILTSHSFLQWSCELTVKAQRVHFWLNSTTVDEANWAASLQTSKPTYGVMTKGDNARNRDGPDSSRCMVELKMEIEMRKVYIEDLENLHNSLLQLESNP